MTTTPNPQDDGGHAFPWGEHGTRLGALSMRDYFAAKAMQGDIAANTSQRPDAAGCATWAYEMADAMLKARQENTNG